MTLSPTRTTFFKQMTITQENEFWKLRSKGLTKFPREKDAPISGILEFPEEIIDWSVIYGHDI